MKKETEIISIRSARRTWGLALAVAVLVTAVIVAVVAISLPKKSEAQELEDALDLGDKYLFCCRYHPPGHSIPTE